MAAPIITGGYTEVVAGSNTGDGDSGASIIPTLDENGDSISLSNQYGFGANQGISFRFSAVSGNTYGARMDVRSPTEDFSAAGRLLCVSIIPGTTNFDKGVFETVANDGFNLALADSNDNYVRVTCAGRDRRYDGTSTDNLFDLVLVRIDSIDENFIIQESATAVDDADIEQLAFTFKARSTFSNTRVIVYDWGYVDPYRITAGEIADPSSFASIYVNQGSAVGDASVTSRIYTRAGNKQYAIANQIFIGDGTTTTYFDDESVSIEIRENANASKFDVLRHYPNNFLGLWFDLTASCVVKLSNARISSDTPWTWNFTANASASADYTGMIIDNAGDITLAAPADHTNNTFRRCAIIKMNGATIDNSTIENSTDVLGALRYNQAGSMDDVLFNNNVVDIEIPASAPTSVTFTNVTFTSSPTDVNIIDLRTGTVSITIDGGNTPTVRNDGGGTTSILAPNPPVNITVTSTTGVAIENARVYIAAAAGGSASVGTELVNALTDANGAVSTTVAISGDQPISGWARKSTGSPFYKEGIIAGTIDSPDGLTQTVVLVLDE